VLLALGVTLGTLAGSHAQEPPKSSAINPGLVASAVRAPLPAKRAEPGTLVVVKDGELVALTPKGGATDAFGPAGKIDLGAAAGTFADPVRLSPDGKRVAYVVRKKDVAPTILNDPPLWQVVARDLGTGDEQVVEEMRFWQTTLSWSPDGKRLAMTRMPPDKDGPTVLIDLAAGKTEPLGLPAGAAVCEWCRDGKTFLVAYQGSEDKRFRLGLVEKGEKEPRELTVLGEESGAGINNAGGIGARFSPDGKKLLFLDTDPAVPPVYRCFFGYKPYVLDVATRKREPLAGVRKDAHCVSAIWSPDGKRVAYTWLQLPADRLAKLDDLTREEIHSETDAFLSVMDADGKNPITVVTGKATQWHDRRTLGSVDWR
jgi:Tol biopolymer transport system component